MSPALVRNTFIRPHLNLGYSKNLPSGVNSLPELIAFNAVRNPEHIFGVQIRLGNISPCTISFQQLQFAVLNASTWLVKSGVTTGRSSRKQKIPPVGILLGSDITIFMYMAALLRIGTPVLCLSARLSPAAIAHLITQTSPSAILIDGQVRRAVFETRSILKGGPVPSPQFFDALSYLDLTSPVSDMASIPPAYSKFRYHDLDAIIMHSSGTTGLPKPIFHSQTYPLIYASCHRLPEQREPFRFCVSTLPLYHGFGLLAPSLSLSIGMPFVLPPASTIPTARLTLEMIESTHAWSLLSVPSILEDIVTLNGTAGLEILKNLDFVAIGGAPMKETVGKQLASSGVKLLNHWGATEIGAIAPIERVPHGYDWHYLMPRTDIGLTILPVGDSRRIYRLAGCAPGWRNPYEVQDYLEVHPLDNKQFKILGRVDDLIVLASGEKVRPTNIERAVAEHPFVKDALAFGDGQMSLGLLVELIPGAVDDISRLGAHQELLASIYPYLERGNLLTDNHGKVSKEMVLFTQAEIKPLVRTDKGSLARKATFSAFDDEIKLCYERSGSLEVSALPSPSVDGGLALLHAIRDFVQNATGIDDFNGTDSRNWDAVDFFEAGMDSLQASRLQRSILSGLRASESLHKSAMRLPPDFCFQHSTIKKLHSALASIMNGSVGMLEAKKVTRIAAMGAMVEKYHEELLSILSATPRTNSLQSETTGTAGAIVLLTGSTGNLGCMLLHRLATDHSVSRVICLNRPRSIDIRRRQIDALATRGVVIPPDAWNKILLCEAEMSQPNLGLDEEEYTKVSSNLGRKSFRLISI
jgi:long-subunit acyl-CoA synthetase (AMP-forming)